MNRTPDELLVGVFALALVPLIALSIHRRVGDGRLPIYRTTLEVDDSKSRFTVLLALHALSFVLVAVIRGGPNTAARPANNAVIRC